MKQAAVKHVEEIPSNTSLFEPAVGSVERGCGYRTAGGIYATCGLGPHGCPVEQFLIDPPVPLDVAGGFPLPAQGMALIEHQGTWHLVDRVGKEYYPFVADFVEEARKLGVSRRVQKNLKATVNGKAVNGFSLLTPASRLLLAHDRAFVVNWPEYLEYHPDGKRTGWQCPEGDPSHAPQFCDHISCAGLWWSDLPEPDPKAQPPFGTQFPISTPGIYGVSDSPDKRAVLRVLPSLAYNARCRPKGIEPFYGDPAFFMSVPITALHVITGGNQHETLEMAKIAQLPVWSMPQ